MKLAIIGKIGSGKTTVSKYIESEYNFYHFDCDKEVKLMYKDNLNLIKEINTKILNTNSSHIDMDNLKHIIINNDKIRHDVENIVFKFLREKIHNLNKTNIVFDCYKIDALKIKVDYKVYIMIDENIEINRVLKRDNRDLTEIKKFISIQKNINNKYDFIISNNENKKKLNDKINLLMNKIGVES